MKSKTFTSLTEDFSKKIGSINNPEKVESCSGHDIKNMMESVDKNLDKILSEENLNQEVKQILTEGSLLEFEDFGKDSKNFGKLYKEVEKAYELRMKITKLSYELSDAIGSALKVSRKMKASDFPEDTKSTGGKESTEWSLNNSSKKVLSIQDMLEFSLG